MYEEFILEDFNSKILIDIREIVRVSEQEERGTWIELSTGSEYKVTATYEKITNMLE